MTLPTIQPAVNSGELSPQIFGRVDLDKYRRGTSTLRNFFASYRGGANSRAGLAFVGQCKQGNRNRALSVSPPRIIAFQFSITEGIVLEFGDRYLRFATNGAYITEVPIGITNIANASPGVVTVPSHPYANGDEVFLTGISGMIQLNNQSFEIANVTANTFTLISTLSGLPIDTPSYFPYLTGGTSARIYTIVTPYAASDLPLLKFTQSADVMSLTHPSYPPYDLARITASDWMLAKTLFTVSIPAPSSIGVSETDSGISTPSFYYQFVATAVNLTTGEESQASPVGTILAVDISTEAATIVINCSTVTGAGSYNFYEAPVAYKNPPTAGSLFGYIGSSFGPSFTDTNVVADFAVTPPLHKNPFATSSLIAVNMTSEGAAYNATATTATVTSPIGQNPVLLPVVINGGIAWTIVENGGAGMTGGELVNFVDSTGAGSGASATLTVGPATGTYPGVVSYFQQRRVYGNTNNNPDTYYASQPGAYTNMDSSIPVTDSDAIIGSPWSQQVNGIQWMINMPGGLVILTGLGAWQLSGAGGGLSTSAALTPSNQVANPQAYNGCSPTVPPIPINYDILYVQEKGSIVRDLSYNFFVNIYTGTDLTVLSNHLFDGFTIVQWAWAEEPNKLIWVVRNDGILLCLTYLKEQDVYAWSRHDTNGIFQSVASVSEPPVNAPYFVVQRFIQGPSVTPPTPPTPPPANTFWDDGGVLALTSNTLYPSTALGLVAGSVWSNGLTIAVVPGVTPDPSAPPVYFGSITPAQLLTLGGGNLPLSNPGVGTFQLWNNNGEVAIADFSSTDSFQNVGGVLQLLINTTYPTSPTSLPDGAVWSNSLVVTVVPGVSPSPTAPPLYFGSTTPALLLALGGGNLPLTNPGAGTMQLWNNSGVVNVA